MGTETAYPIGTVLKRRKPQGDDLDELRVTGGGKELVVTSNKGFGANFQMDAAKARAEYETDFPDEVFLSRPTFIDPGPTPEQVFSGETTEGDGKTRMQRADELRDSGDLRGAYEAAKQDTGKPVLHPQNDEPAPEPPKNKGGRPRKNPPKEEA